MLARTGRLQEAGATHLAHRRQQQHLCVCVCVWWSWNRISSGVRCVFPRIQPDVRQIHQRWSDETVFSSVLNSP